VEAEVRSALLREGVEDIGKEVFRAITWLYATRALTREFERVLSAGYLKGADLWHLACALLVAPEPGEISFLTLDRRQREIASAIGFSA
jgi:hypothetical protein